MADDYPAEEVTKNFELVFRPDLLKGKVAFITGGATGIGFTITEYLMRYGCDVAIASRKLDRLQAAQKTLQEATGRKCFIQQMDVRNPKDVTKTVQAILGEYNRLDILVNNAAGNFLAPAASLSANAYKTVMEIDAMGTFNVSKAVFENYFNSHGGVIVNISATLAYKGTVLQAHAASAKAAIDTLTKVLANEWGELGIRVVGVAPGPIGDTEGFRRLGGRSPHVDMYKQMIPLQRMGNRYEMANTVLFLVSNGASYITGETVVADGGAWMSTPNNMSTAQGKL